MTSDTTVRDLLFFITQDVTVLVELCNPEMECPHLKRAAPSPQSPSSSEMM